MVRTVRRDVNNQKGAAMLERDGYVSGVPCWVDTSQPDPEAAVAFYSGLFGWDFEDAMPPGSAGKYLIARLRGGDVAAVASQPEGGPPMAAWNTYIWVESADEAASKVLAAGGLVLMDPFDIVDAGRMAAFTDPEGAAFCVWQAKEHRGARIVNESGSLNFNGLNTRDPEGAKSFYGSVFGWETLGFGGGPEMWRLPGYGNFLEQSDPGLRKRMAESSAPVGFEDVVATLSPIADNQPDVPAHWSVTFAVDDADATAERAAALGGEVVVPPFDAPWVRMTVITDPQGATLTASKFVPENNDLGSQADPAVRAA
jgi:predicted enzyme related to lactoylglutathione lyase